MKLLVLFPLLIMKDINSFEDRGFTKELEKTRTEGLIIYLED